MKSTVARVDDTYNNKDLMHFAVARRIEGTIDLYCNFVMVSKVRIPNKKIVSVNIDFNKIYFTTEELKGNRAKKLEAINAKFLKNVPVEDPREYYTIELSQQRLIGQTTYKKISKPYADTTIYH